VCVCIYLSEIYYQQLQDHTERSGIEKVVVGTAGAVILCYFQKGTSAILFSFRKTLLLKFTHRNKVTT